MKGVPINQVIQSTKMSITQAIEELKSIAFASEQVQDQWGKLMKFIDTIATQFMTMALAPPPAAKRQQRRAKANKKRK